MEDLEKWWNENKFRVTLSNLQGCAKDLGYAANEKEIVARKELIGLCREIGKEGGEENG